jgi:hypothetical protein
VTSETSELRERVRQLESENEKLKVRNPSWQGCGSGSQLDPDSVGSVDPDPEEGKNDPQKWNKLKKSYFEVLYGLFWELKASSVTRTFFMEA